MRATTTFSVQWIWRHHAFSLPSDWEMLQFSTDFKRGRCAFANRYQFRFEINWSMVKGEPDYDRMLSDYTSKLEQQKSLTDTELLKKNGWYGFWGFINDEMTSRFGRYYKETGCLMECVFLWPDERDAALESAILSNISAIPTDIHGHQRWRAFGLDMRLPPTAIIEKCTAQPARTVFSFSNPKTGAIWEFSRLGMVKSWLKTDVENWLSRTLDADRSSLRFTHQQRHGADVVHASGTFKPAGLHLRRGKVESAAWICPEDGRLYHVAKRTRQTNPNDELPIDELLSAAPEFTPRWV